jgi:ribosomal protein S27AE
MISYRADAGKLMDFIDAAEKAAEHLADQHRHESCPRCGMHNSELMSSHDESRHLGSQLAEAVDAFKNDMLARTQ